MTNCKICGEEIFQSEKELEYFKSRGFEPRKKCKNCKADEKQQKIRYQGVNTCSGVDL